MILLTYTSGLYIWYRFAMWLIGRKHKIREKNLLLFYFYAFLALIGLICDVLYNLTLGSILFLQFPREWTLSQRMKRIHKGNRRGYRYKLARYICEQVLNPHDPSGNHC